MCDCVCVCLCVWVCARVCVCVVCVAGGVCVCVCVHSEPEEEHLPPAVSEAQPLHAVQPLGRTLQHHVHPPGPIQRPQHADQQTPVLRPQGTHTHTQRDTHTHTHTHTNAQRKLTKSSEKFSSSTPLVGAVPFQK